MSTAIPRRKYPVSLAPGSQATSGPVSTWMGDRLGIPGAVDFFFFICVKPWTYLYFIETEIIFASNLNYSVEMNRNLNFKITVQNVYSGDVAQMVERSLSMREVQGSTPCFSKYQLFFFSEIWKSMFVERLRNWNWIYFYFNSKNIGFYDEKLFYVNDISSFNFAKASK